MYEIENLLNDNQKQLDALGNLIKNRDYKGKIQQLEQRSSAPDFWQTSDSASVMEELNQLLATQNALQELATKNHELAELYSLFKGQEDSLPELETQLKQAAKQLKKLKLKMFLTGTYDSYPCYLSINPGAGGTESQDWAEMLLRMYLRFCEQNGLNHKVIDLQKGEGAGIKSGIINISGNNAYGLLKAESGVHRLVRISPFDSNKRRHTSFASVYVMPEVPENAVQIAPEQLKIDTFRAGGAGGQHVNTTDSAVRITHLPTGIVVQCQNERSQGQNKQQAMKFLMAKLTALEQQKRQEAQNVALKKKIEWGSQIRSYVLHPYKMVKDHRTEAQSNQPERVLDGDIMEFIEAFLQEN